MSFGKKLKELRKTRELTQAELAEGLKVSKGLISLYETDTRKPSYEMLETVADYFNVNLGYLMDDTPNDDDEIWAMREELLRRPELKVLFDLSSKASKKDVERTIRIIEALGDEDK